MRTRILALKAATFTAMVFTTAIGALPGAPRHAAQRALAAAQTAPWPTARGDKANTGRSTSSVANRVKAWQFQPDPHKLASPAVFSSAAIGARGQVYMSMASLYALDQVTGAVKWEYYPGDALTLGPVVGAGERVYDASLNRAFAIDGSTGRRLWSHSLGARVVGSLAVSSQGRIYACCSDGKVYCLNANTGALEWSVSASASLIHTSPAIGPDDSVYIAAPGSVIALEGATGRKIWGVAGPADIRLGSPAISDDGMLYACATVGSTAPNLSGKVIALNLRSGDTVWSFPTDAFLTYPPALDNDLAIVGCGNGHVYALNRNTGAVRWQFNAGAWIATAPGIDSDGSVVISAYNQKIYRLDAVSGRILQSHDLGVNTQSSPSIGADGTIYIGTLDGRFLALPRT